MMEERRRREFTGPHPDPMSDALSDVQLRWRQLWEEYQIRGHAERHTIVAFRDALIAMGIPLSP